MKNRIVLEVGKIVQENIELKEGSENLVSILTNIYQELGVDKTLVFTDADIANIRTVLKDNKKTKP